MNLLKKFTVVALVVTFGFAAVGVASATLDYDTESDCLNNDGYWYDGTCYETENAKLQAQVNALTQRIDQLLKQLGEEPTEEPATGGNVPAECEGVSFDRALDVGMSGDDVLCLQTMLNQDLEQPIADSGPGSPGEETSYFGSITKGGVVTFQEKYSEDVLAPWDLTQGTGYVGKTTREKLNFLLDEWAKEEEKEASDYTEQSACEDAGYYWYDDACHEEEEGKEVTGEGLQVSLADDNPSSATIISGTGGGNAQSLIPFLKLKFSNGDDSEVSVTELKFTRSGISSDSDISQGYLYEGSEKVAEYSSFSSKVMAFSNSSGLFSIPAGESKVITLKNDIASGTNSGKTFKFSLDSSSDLSSDASEVSGDFALGGNTMTSATVSDLGQITIAGTSSSPTNNVDPQDDYEVFNFNLQAGQQDMEVRRLVFTNTGSVDTNDLQNFELYKSGVKAAGPVQMASDDTVTFDLSDSPIEISAGVTKTMALKADIVGGVNRNFKFSFQNMTDIRAYDTEYGVYVKPNQQDSWTVVDPSGTCSINPGKMTFSKTSDSPSGNVAKGATNVTLLKFTADATGEQVKITGLTVEETNGQNMDKVKVYQDGVQKGSTNDLTASASYSFGNTFVVDNEEDSTIKIVGDIKDDSANDISAGTTLDVKVKSVSAKGKTSLSSVSPGTISSYSLEVSGGALSASKNLAQPDWSTSNYTAAQGAGDALLGSFDVSAGSGEGADITSIKMVASSTLFDDVQNVELYNGTKDSGTKIGDTKPSVSSGNKYSFYPSPYVSLDASESFTLNVYADVLSGASVSGSAGNMKINKLNGIGHTTDSSIATTVNTVGQPVYFSGQGTMAVSQDIGTPDSDLMVMGDSNQVFSELTFDASSSPEDIEVTEIIASTTISSGDNDALKNITLSGNGINEAKTSLDSNGQATFDLSGDPWVVSAGTEETLTMKADINSYASGAFTSSGMSIKMGTATTTYKGAQTGNSTTTGSAGSGWGAAGNAMYVYRTKPTVTASPFSSSFSGNLSYKLLEFTIAADANKDLKVKKIGGQINLTDATSSADTDDLYVSNLELYDKSDMDTILNGVVATSSDGSAGSYATNTDAAVKFGDTGGGGNSSESAYFELKNAGTTTLDTIPAGDSVTYVVKVTANDAASGDSIKAKLTDPNDSNSSNDPAQGGDTALVWSDYMTSFIDSDYVSGLPTDWFELSW